MLSGLRFLFGFPSVFDVRDSISCCRCFADFVSISVVGVLSVLCWRLFPYVHLAVWLFSVTRSLLCLWFCVSNCVTGSVSFVFAVWARVVMLASCLLGWFALCPCCFGVLFFCAVWVLSFACRSPLRLLFGRLILLSCLLLLTNVACLRTFARRSHYCIELPSLFFSSLPAEERLTSNWEFKPGLFSAIY